MAEMKQKAQPSRSARIAIAATGIGATAMLLVAAFLPALPMYGDSLNDWGRWASSHQSGAGLSVRFLAFAYLLYMVFGAYLATLVGRDDLLTRWLVRLATVAVGVKFAIEMMQIAILSLPIQIGPGDFVPALAQLGTELSVFGLVPFFVYLLAVGAAGLISRAVPAWLAWVTLVVGAIQAFAMVLGLTGAPGPIGPALVAFGTVWFFSIIAWPLVTAIGLIVVDARGFEHAPGATVVASELA